MKWRKIIAVPLAAAAYSADIVCVVGVTALYGAMAWRVLQMPAPVVAVTTVLVAAAAYWLTQAFPRSRALRWWMAISVWGDGAGRHAAPPAVQPVAPRPITTRPASERVSLSTQPRTLAPYEIPAWTPCPACERKGSAGTHHWDDRGPYQLISVFQLECPAGHRWSHHTDGG